MAKRNVDPIVISVKQGVATISKCPGDMWIKIVDYDSGSVAYYFGKVLMEEHVLNREEGKDGR